MTTRVRSSRLPSPPSDAKDWRVQAKWTLLALRDFFTYGAKHFRLTFKHGPWTGG